MITNPGNIAYLQSLLDVNDASQNPLWLVPSDIVQHGGTI